MEQMLEVLATVPFHAEALAPLRLAMDATAATAEAVAGRAAQSDLN